MYEFQDEAPPSPNLPDRAMERRHVSHQPAPLTELGCFPLQLITHDGKAWLRESGELVLAAAAESWLFLWIVDPERAEAHTRVAWPLGEWLSHYYEITFDGDTLWVIVHHNLVEISCRDWEIRSCRCFRDFVPEGAIIEESLLVSGSDYLWVRTSLPADIFLVEIKTWKVHRRFGDLYDEITPISGTRPLLCLTDSDERSALYRLDGTPVTPSELPTADLMYSMAPAPHGPGLMTLQFEESMNSDLGEIILRYFAPDKSGSFRFIDELSREAIELAQSQVVVSRDESLCFVVAHLNRRRRPTHLLAVAVSRRSGCLKVRYRVEVPHDLILVQDRTARRVVALFTDGSGLRTVPIGRERPSFDLPGALFDYDYLDIPNVGLNGLRSCHIPHGDDGRDRSYPLSRQIRHMSPDDRLRFIGHYKHGFEDDVEELTDLYYAIRTAQLLQDDQAAKELEEEQEDVARLLRKHATHPTAALVIADREARAGHWHEVRRWLRVAHGNDYQDNRNTHVLHLEGLLLMNEGRGDEAFGVFSKAESFGRTECFTDVTRLAQLTCPMADPPKDEEWDAAQPLLRQVLGALRTADWYRSRGDDEAALAALDRPIFWYLGEVQIAARRAEIFLAKPDAKAKEVFHKRFVLATLRESRWNRLHRKEVCLPGVTWDRERIDRIDELAREWLERSGSPGRIPD